VFFGLVLGGGAPVKVPKTGFIGTTMIGDFAISFICRIKGMAADGTGE